MIRGFADKETERIWNEERSRKLPQDIQDKALRKLQLIEAAERIDDLRVSAWQPVGALEGRPQGPVVDSHQRPVAHLL